jgi:hypothetical protein
MECVVLINTIPYSVFFSRMSSLRAVDKKYVETVECIITGLLTNEY